MPGELEVLIAVTTAQLEAARAGQWARVFQLMDERPLVTGPVDSGRAEVYAGLYQELRELLSTRLVEVSRRLEVARAVRRALPPVEPRAVDSKA